MSGRNWGKRSGLLVAVSLALLSCSGSDSDVVAGVTADTEAERCSEEPQVPHPDDPGGFAWLRTSESQDDLVRLEEIVQEIPERSLGTYIDTTGEQMVVVLDPVAAAGAVAELQARFDGAIHAFPVEVTVGCNGLNHLEDVQRRLTSGQWFRKWGLETRPFVAWVDARSATVVVQVEASDQEMRAALEEDFGDLVSVWTVPEGEDFRREPASTG